MYNKPVTFRGNDISAMQMRGRRPVNEGVNFSSFMAQNGTQAPLGPSGGGAPLMPSVGQPQGKTPLEQAATQGNLGLNQMRALAALSDTGIQGSSTQGTGARQAEPTRGQGLPLNPRDIFKLLTRGSTDLESAETALRVKGHRGKSEGKGAAAVIASAGKAGRAQFTSGTEEAQGVGKLAAQFESGAEGAAAIGYDRHGGTSYGQYQISSRAGSMRSFVEFLKTEAPDLAGRLEQAGPMNTGSKRGKMPDEWQAIAEENPDRFESLQDRFIRASHYEPAIRAIAEKTGIALDAMPAALQEVVFSTAVQHGPTGATNIIARALGQVGEKRLDPASEPTSLAKAQENLIRRIYDNRSGQFRSSTQAVQESVKNRLQQEMGMAISMLRGERTGA